VTQRVAPTTTEFLPGRGATPLSQRATKMKTEQHIDNARISDGRVFLGRPLSSAVARQVRDLAYRFPCDVTIDTRHGGRADGRNLLALLMLGAREGDEVLLHCKGQDAGAAFEALRAILGRARREDKATA
jgi:phosphotransferase system HPr (HPr) family protein